MEGFYDRCKELFDAGQRAEFIRYCRDSMAAQITLRGSYWHGQFGQEFLARRYACLNSRMGECIPHP